MKKILILAILAITFIGCGVDNKTVEEKKSLSCADIYTEEYIKSKYTNINEVKSSFTSGTCGYWIQTKSEIYNTSYNIRENATEQMLTQVLSYFSGVKPFSELGDDAYIYSVGSIKQVTLLNNGNLITSSIWLGSNSQFSKEQTIELVLDMNEKLK